MERNKAGRAFPSAWTVTVLSICPPTKGSDSTKALNMMVAVATTSGVDVNTPVMLLANKPRMMLRTTPITEVMMTPCTIIARTLG